MPEESFICKIQGKVIKGSQYGRKIGFPTINIDRRFFLKLKQKPKFGIYAGTVEISNKNYRAAIVIGPKDIRGIPKIEAHIIGFSGDAYRKKAVIFAEKFIRNFKKFKSEKELIRQIEKDILIAKK